MEVHFEIENGCLLKCRHCSSLATKEEKRMNYNINEMINFLQLFSEEKSVFLTGGEPLLHNDLDDIIFSLGYKQNNVSVGAFTTGIVLENGRLCEISEKRAFELANLGLETCYFSVYSTQDKKHDWMTQKEGSLALTIESIRRLRRENVDAKINLVITKMNKEEIDDIIAMASSLGCTEVRLLKLINHGRAKNYWEDIGITDREYREIVLECIHAYKDIKITASGCPDILPCRSFQDSQKCQAGSKLVYITYEGNVYPCACVKNDEKYKIGKINDIEILKKYFNRQDLFRKNALCKI